MFGNYTKLLVPVDESEQSTHSFEKAVAIAKRNEAKIYLLHVIDSRNFSLPPEIPNLDIAEIDEAFLSEKEKMAQEAGVEIEKVILKGDPRLIISESFPKKKGIDLIVIGATGKGAVSRMFLGSVSSYVTKHAFCDVLIIR